MKASAHSLPSLLASLAMVLTVGVLWAIRKRPAAGLSIAIFFSTTIVLLAMIWANHNFYFQTGKFFEPFAGEKLLALTLAMVAPSVLWVGIPTILLTGLVPVVQFLLLSSAWRAQLPFQEPWVTLFYMVIALFLFESRRRWRKVRRAAVKAEERSQLLQEISYLLINAQHLANTPLQTAEYAVAILKMRYPGEEEQFALLERSCGRVREVMRLLSFCNDYLDWREMNLPKSPAEFENRLRDLMAEGNLTAATAATKAEREQGAPPTYSR